MKKPAVLSLIAIICSGCAERVPRADDEAMMIYRECMNGMPQPLTAQPSPQALSNPGARQSVDSVVRSEAASKMQSNCARLAGWEEK